MTDTPGELSSIAERLALATPAEGAGVLAGGVACLAAALCEAIARGSLEAWVDARGVAVQAATLRARAADASAANARAYATARDELIRRRPPGTTGRDAALRAALIAAADTLLAIASAAGDCTWLAAELAYRCTPELRGDAVGAAELAAAAARSAGALVDINLALLPGDERRQRASAMVAAAEHERARARAAMQAQ